MPPIPKPQGDHRTRDLGGYRWKVDVFVAGVGTGGTVTGTGGFLKEKNPDIHIVAVEPEDSPVLSGGRPGPHGIQGIGAGFVPEILDTEVYSEVMKVKTQEPSRRPVCWLSVRVYWWEFHPAQLSTRHFSLPARTGSRARPLWRFCRTQVSDTCPQHSLKSKGA